MRVSTLFLPCRPVRVLMLTSKFHCAAMPPNDSRCRRRLRGRFVEETACRLPVAAVDAFSSVDAAERRLFMRNNLRAAAMLFDAFMKQFQFTHACLAAAIDAILTSYDRRTARRSIFCQQQSRRRRAYFLRRIDLPRFISRRINASRQLLLQSGRGISRIYHRHAIYKGRVPSRVVSTWDSGSRMRICRMRDFERRRHGTPGAKPM